MFKELLIKIGLSQREVELYSILLKEGELMASELSKKSEMIRTNVYDVTNSLIQKGIISYVIKNGRKYFRATDPEKLLDYINTQEKDLAEIKIQVKEILPKLIPSKENTTKPIIEVYEGKEGLKTILAMSMRESIKTKKEILGISVQQQRCRDLGGIYHVRWYKERERLKIKSRYIMSAQEVIIPIKYTQMKVLPTLAKNPNEIFIFGDITTQFFFNENLFTAIVINNKTITDKYRSYFEFLWNVV